MFEAVSKIREISDRKQRSMVHMSLAWLRKQPGVSCILMGARNRAQVQSNLEFLDLNLDSETENQLRMVTEALKKKIGSDNLDPYETKEFSRIK